MRIHSVHPYRANTIWTVVVLLFALVTGIAIANSRWLYLGIVFVPFLVYICKKTPFIFPFGAYVFLIPFDSVLAVTGNTEGATITKFLGIMTILVFLFKGVFEDKFKKPDTAIIWLILLISYSLLTIFWAIQPEIISGLIPTALGLLLLYLVIASYQIKKTEFETVKNCILAGGFVAALYIIYTYMISSQFNAQFQRATMLVGNRAADPNYFVLTLIMPVSVCIHHMMRIKNSSKAKVMYGMVLGVILFSIIITGSRGGLIGTLAVALVYILFTRQRVKLAAILIISGIALIQFIPDVFFERVHDAIETRGIGRTHLLYVGLKAFDKYWLFGAGLNNFVKAFTEFSIYDVNFQGFDRGAHNLFLGTFVELGIVGGGLFITMIIKHYRVLNAGLYNNNQDDQIMIKAALLGILITSFFLDSMFRKSFWLIFMMIMMYRNICEEEQSC